MQTAISQRLKILEDTKNPLYLTVHPISSGEEKLGLEMQAIQDFKTPKELIDDICTLYGISIDLPHEIKLAGLLKVKEISNGPDTHLKYKCSNCMKLTESTLMLDGMLDFSAWSLLNSKDFGKDLSTNVFKKVTFKTTPRFQDLELIKNANPSNIVSLLDVDISKLRKLRDLNFLALALRARYPKFKHEMSTTCMFCGNKDRVLIDDAFVLNSLSEHSISSMYKTYHSLLINGFTKSDVDSMFPFEREVHIGLIDERVEKLKKAREIG